MSPQEPLFTMMDPRGLPAAPVSPFQAAVPAWLADRLEGPEGVNPERRGPYAKLVPCGRCGLPVLTAADAGLDFVTDSTADPYLLDGPAELAVLLARRYTVEADVLKWGRGIMLYRRDRWLAQKPAAARNRYCLPEHKCGQPAGAALPYQMLYPHLYAQIHNPQESPDAPF